MYFVGDYPQREEPPLSPFSAKEFEIPAAQD